MQRRRLVKAGSQLNEHDLEPGLLHHPESIAPIRQRLDSGRLEVTEVGGVIDMVVGVELVKANPNFKAVDHEPKSTNGSEAVPCEQTEEPHVTR